MKKIFTALILSMFLAALAGCAETEKPAKTEAPAASLAQPETTAPPGNESAPADKAGEIRAVEASFPAPVGDDTDPAAFIGGDEHFAWWEDYREKRDESVNRQREMDDFYEDIQEELLEAGPDGNTVCSPLNIYFALSMLAEISDGRTREQILDELEVHDLEELRGRVKALWEANCLDTPVIKSKPANSLWIRDDIGYHGDTLERLAEDYHASSYIGTMGSGEMDRRLQEWTDDHTGGLLKEYTGDLHLRPETVMALVSTLYYKASWTERFQEERTDTAIFHGASGDTEVSMMHRDDMMRYFAAKEFRGVSLGLSDSGAMLFFLPEDGTDVRELADDSDVVRICCGKDWPGENYPIVHLSVPKFRVSKKIDLMDVIKRMDITDALDPEKADFSPLTDEVEKIWLDAAEHAAMVEIDEEGVTGAAYTELAMNGMGAAVEDVDFTLDRPFYFAIASGDGSILFSGIVQEIN